MNMKRNININRLYAIFIMLDFESTYLDYGNIIFENNRILSFFIHIYSFYFFY